MCPTINNIYFLSNTTLFLKQGDKLLKENNFLSVIINSKCTKPNKLFKKNEFLKKNLVWKSELIEGSISHLVMEEVSAEECV